MSGGKIKSNFKYKAVVILLVVSIGLSSISLPVISSEYLSEQNDFINRIDNNTRNQEYKETDYVRYDFIFGCQQDQKNLRKDLNSFSQKSIHDVPQGSLYSAIIPYEKAIEFENEFAEIKEQFKNEKTPEKNKEYSEKAFDIFIKYEIFPECFTYENMTEFMYQLSKSIYLELSEKKSDDARIFSRLQPRYNTQENNSDLKMLTIAGPFSIFSYLTFLGSVNPFGVIFNGSGFSFIPIEIIELSVINITANKTGLCFDAERLPENSPLNKYFPFWINFSGPIWDFLWKDSDEDSYRQWKINFLVALYYPFYILRGNAISNAMVWGPQLDGVTGEFQTYDDFKGNFWYLATPWTVPISFTLYNTWPEPWTVKLEAGILNNFGISLLLSRDKPFRLLP